MKIATIKEETKKVVDFRLDIQQSGVLKSILDKVFLGVYDDGCELPYQITAEEAKLMMLLIEDIEQIEQEL